MSSGFRNGIHLVFHPARMKYITARQIWRDCHAVLPASGEQHLDPKTDSRKPSPHRHVIHATETRSAKGNDLQVLNAVQMGKAQSIIARLDPIQRAWGMYAYTDMFTTSDHEALRQWMWNQANWQSPNYKKMLRSMILIDLCLENMRSVFNTGSTKLRQHKILQVNKQNMSRDGWNAKIDILEGMIDNLDKDALAPLGILL